MLILVLADNLLLLYLGWEGVGLCSYLLIGFWYKDRDNVRAAMKAFWVTRIGDTAFAIGIFLLFTSLGTLQIQPILSEVSRYPVGIASVQRRGGLAPGRRSRQVGPASAARVAARCDGRPDAGQRADSRGHDGDRRRVPHRPYARALPEGADRPVHRGGYRCGDAADGRLSAP